MRKMKKYLLEITFYKCSNSTDSSTCLWTTVYDAVGNHDRTGSDL